MLFLPLWLQYPSKTDRTIRINIRLIVRYLDYPQEPILFNATIADNLRMGLPDITPEQMVHVCKMANAHDFIITLPQVRERLRPLYRLRPFD